MQTLKALFLLCLLGVVGFVLVGFVWVKPAEAVPSFARSYDKQCSYCHISFPMLNRKGREFKELGYKLEEEEGKFDLLGENFPISAMFISRPYDKRSTGGDKIRAFHEIEIFFAGQVAQQWSAFAEIEAEDEGGFDELEFAPLMLGWNLHRAFNLQFVWGPFFFADPYGFLGDGFRLTRGHVGFIDQRFGGADANGRLRDNRQIINVYGRPIDQVFYTFGVSGPEGDAEGVEPRNFHGRVAVEPYTRSAKEGLPLDFMIGAFGIVGECDEGSGECEGRENFDFNRFGVDGQADIGNARIQAAWITANDDVASDVDNDAFSIQGLYTIKKGKRPWIVPLVRYDFYEQSDGEDEFDEITLNLTYFFEENVKAYVEFWKRFDAPGDDEQNRFTLQIHVGF
jgi:hypothetical protein